MMIHPLISAPHLHDMLKQPSLRLFDCRYLLTDPTVGQRAYDNAHLPGAVFVDVNRDLSAPHLPGRTSRHPLPTRSAWLATVQRLGISADSLVVLYDDGGGASSARMWWMLQWIGHARVVVLDGGWQAWTALTLPVTADVSLPKATAAAYPQLESLVQLVTADTVNGQQQLLLDARDLARFKGEVEPLDPVAGHIPGALCSPFSGNLASNGCFKTPVELRDKFAVAIGSERPVVCYCGSGITACHNILAMAVAGLPLPALYAGSWSEWITDPKRPIARGLE
jgi:thiosulfate/3-mercaptopyruvate sulfurtransferase